MVNSIDEIRQLFLDFFNNKGHQIIDSSSLIPKNDPTLLFTNAGMNQFKDAFLNSNKCKFSKVTTSQCCIRVGGKHNDLENVGYTNYHHTFFEMLGNFSFGDYFKHEAIQYAWELLTNKHFFNLPKDRLWITVYKNDEETYQIWTKYIGIPNTRVICVDDNKGLPYTSDNFWQMCDTGPCGPCTEIFYDKGNHISSLPLNKNDMENKNNRYIEIWNIVFIQFNKYADGTMEILEKPSVDTGMGLERIASILQCVDSNYEIDSFSKLIKSVAEITNTIDLTNKSLRVIADHIRCSAFLIAEGLIPSNENRNYVLRRIIRRAICHGNLLGMNNTFLYKLVNPLIESIGLIGNRIKFKQNEIKQILKNEEEQFRCTLKRGLKLLNNELKVTNNNILNGEIVFRLYDTYGFPIDLTRDICREHNIKIDEDRFKKEMEKQKKRGRKSNNFIIDYSNISNDDNYHTFQAYNNVKLHSNVTALFIEGKVVNKIKDGQEAIIFLDKTPFYAESGGQVGDKGKLEGNNFNITVNNTRKYGKLIGHLAKINFGYLEIGNNVQAIIDEEHRNNVSLNHTATHLIHAALRKILGNHIKQKGSLVNERMLRFDFSHYKAMEVSEIYEVENLVNTQIRFNIPIKINIMDLDEAKSKGAIAIFDEKYEKKVRVLNIGDFSTELCIGTHAKRTGDIGFFHIISESSIAMNTRRIEAVTGKYAIYHIQKKNDQFRCITQLLNSNYNKLSKYNCKLDNKIHRIIKHTNQLEYEIKKLKEQIIIQKSVNLLSKIIKIKNIKLIIKKIEDIEHKMLLNIVNNIRRQENSIVIVLATIFKNKLILIAGVSKDLISKITAKAIINIAIRNIDGKGGGNSEIAQAGSKNTTTINTALSNVEKWINEKL